MIRKYLPGLKLPTRLHHAYTGVRESRRLVGKKKLTLQDVLALNIPEDTVAIAGYNRDTHSPKDGQMHLLAVEHGVGIPYGCLVSENVEGFSSRQEYLHRSGRVVHDSSDARPALRVGQASGTAAALAVREKCTPSQLNVAELRQELVQDGAIIDLP